MDFFNNNGRANYSPVAQGFMAKVYGWMCGGLLLSGATAYVTSPEFAPLLFSKLMNGPIFVLALINLALGIMFPYLLNRIDYVTAIGMFVAYATINGVIFSPIFAIYTMSSIVYCFLAAALMFGIMAVYGWVTRTDLTSLGMIMIMGLVGLIVCNFINYFVGSKSFDLFSAAAMVLIFCLLTAYDVQKIKMMTRYQMVSSDDHGKLALLGALILYLDIVNIFLQLLKLFGDKKRR